MHTSSESVTRPVGDGFLGRRGELATMTGALEWTRVGCGRAFLLVGEAGIGKTRLAREVCERAGADGIRAFWGRAWDGSDAPAYWLWPQIVRALELSARAGGRQPTPGPWQLLLDDASAKADRPITPGLEVNVAEHARFALFDSVVRLLASECAVSPCVLVLDDLHWADQPSIELLVFVTRLLPKLHLLLIGTYREVEANLDPDRHSGLSRVAREATLLSLAELDSVEVAALTSAGSASRPVAGPSSWRASPTRRGATHSSSRKSCAS